MPALRQRFRPDTNQTGHRYHKQVHNQLRTPAVPSTCVITPACGNAVRRISWYTFKQNQDQFVCTATVITYQEYLITPPPRVKRILPNAYMIHRFRINSEARGSNSWYLKNTGLTSKFSVVKSAIASMESLHGLRIYVPVIPTNYFIANLYY